MIASKWGTWYLTMTSLCKPPAFRYPYLFPLKIVLGITNVFGLFVFLYYDNLIDAKNNIFFTRSKEADVSVCFQKLPLTIQRRFYQLQIPTTQYNVIKAYPGILKATRMLIVDGLEIDLKNIYRSGGFHQPPKVLDIEPDWALDQQSYPLQESFCKPYDQLNMRIKNAESLEKYIHHLRNIIPRKYTLFSSLNFNHLPYLIKHCDLSHISRLEIIYSNLNEKDLEVIKGLKNLKCIRMGLKNSSTFGQIYLRNLLECLQSIPNIKIYFDVVYDGDFIESLLVEWVIKYGYCESVFFTFRHPEEGRYITFASEQVTFFLKFNIHK